MCRCDGALAPRGVVSLQESIEWMRAAGRALLEGTLHGIINLRGRHQGHEQRRGARHMLVAQNFKGASFERMTGSFLSHRL